MSVTRIRWKPEEIALIAPRVIELMQKGGKYFPSVCAVQDELLPVERRRKLFNVGECKILTRYLKNKGLLVGGGRRGARFAMSPKAVGAANFETATATHVASKPTRQCSFNGLKTADIAAELVRRVIVELGSGSSGFLRDFSLIAQAAEEYLTRPVTPQQPQVFVSPSPSAFTQNGITTRASRILRGSQV